MAFQNAKSTKTFVGRQRMPDGVVSVYHTKNNRRSVTVSASPGTFARAGINRGDKATLMVDPETRKALVVKDASGATVNPSSKGSHAIKLSLTIDERFAPSLFNGERRYTAPVTTDDASNGIVWSCPA